ncbi:ASCH domain-containing protein [Planococcus sp. N028]|uniref:ASCH domain-containing protein n=1 Tax=Planococcus shixiaomingii TaxID=3058393 RepID=A0ABT8MYG1_9BACL|nr:ASCH domain-containing protein [Planococcus sp. N028]MDN7240674.1 ASCH domain-containing protein [Planococcus sp. N028]
MNEQTSKFWNSYWASQEQKPLKDVEAFQFGADADWLAALVAEGKKTATCSAHVWYEFENESLPQVGQYNIVLNSKEEPVAIKVTEVSIMPMNEVPEDFALAEGEGDYAFWWNAHEQFFKSELGAQGLPYSETMLLVCERFEVIHKS